MTIVDLQTTVIGTPRQALTFLALETDSGLVGLGEVGMVNKTGTLLAYIRELAPRYVVGTRPSGRRRGRSLVAVLRPESSQAIRSEGR